MDQAADHHSYFFRCGVNDAFMGIPVLVCLAPCLTFPRDSDHFVDNSDSVSVPLRFLSIYSIENGFDQSVNMDFEFFFEWIYLKYLE